MIVTSAKVEAVPPLAEQGKILRQRYVGAGRFVNEDDTSMAGASVVPVELRATILYV